MRAGLDPRTRLLRWSLFLTIVGMVLAVTGADSLDAVATWFRAEYPRLPWYVVRVTGWLAYLGLTVSVIYGLLLSTGILDAIAHRTVGDDRRRIVIDAAGYSARRSATLESMARRSAEQASATGRPVALEPMSAVERRLVHASLKDDPEVETASEGTEPHRYVVVLPRRSAD